MLLFVKIRPLYFMHFPMIITDKSKTRHSTSIGIAVFHGNLFLEKNVTSLLRNDLQRYSVFVQEQNFFSREHRQVFFPLYSDMFFHVHVYIKMNVSNHPVEDKLNCSSCYCDVIACNKYLITRPTAYLFHLSYQRLYCRIVISHLKCL